MKIQVISPAGLVVAEIDMNGSKWTAGAAGFTNDSPLYGEFLFSCDGPFTTRTADDAGNVIGYGTINFPDYDFESPNRNRKWWQKLFDISTIIYGSTIEVRPGHYVLAAIKK